MYKKVAVIGAGPMGLTCAYELAKHGLSVEVFEKKAETGGMSEHFDFSGLSVEKFNHAVYGPDTHLFDLLKELNLYDRLKWVNTKMRLFFDGTLYPWGGPVDLLFFPKARFIEKIRYGLHVFFGSKIKNWKKLDNLNAIPWIKKWEGESCFDKFWGSLFNLKFYEYKDQTSAAWFWWRLVHVAKSRKSIFQERMGYISGGTTVVLEKIKSELEKLGGIIHTAAPVEKIYFEEQSVSSISLAGKRYDFNNVISTIPLQYINGIADLPHDEAAMLQKLDNVGIVCVVTKLNRPLSDYWWKNITDKHFEALCMVEINNLNNELKDRILYTLFYLHHKNCMYGDPDDVFAEKTLNYINRVNPSLTKNNIIDTRIFRYQYAQPVSMPHFIEKLPPMFSEKRKGFYFADTSYGYPHERSMSDSIKIGKELAQLVIAGN
jgi:protoporphyrinogen oxidase